MYIRNNPIKVGVYTQNKYTLSSIFNPLLFGYSQHTNFTLFLRFLYLTSDIIILIWLLFSINCF